MKEILKKYLKKSFEFTEIEFQNIIIYKKLLRSDLKLYFRKIYYKNYLRDHKEHHSKIVSENSKKRYQNDSEYRKMRISQVTINTNKKKSLQKILININ
jgi:hypothetical protein